MINAGILKRLGSTRMGMWAIKHVGTSLDHRLYRRTNGRFFRFADHPHCQTHPLMPRLKIPQAIITFLGMARVIPATETPRPLLEAVFRHMADNQEMVANSCLSKVTPHGEFVTYGIGIPLMQIHFPEKARGRAPVQ